MTQPDGHQALILVKLHMQALYLVLVISDPGRSWRSSCPALTPEDETYQLSSKTHTGPC